MKHWENLVCLPCCHNAPFASIHVHVHMQCRHQLASPLKATGNSWRQLTFLHVQIRLWEKCDHHNRQNENQGGPRIWQAHRCIGQLCQSLGYQPTLTAIWAEFRVSIILSPLMHWLNQCLWSWFEVYSHTSTTPMHGSHVQTWLEVLCLTLFGRQWWD